MLYVCCMYVVCMLYVRCMYVVCGELPPTPPHPPTPLISPLAIWQHYSQKEKAFFQNAFFCFCLRVTDMSYRNVSGTSNNCQALSVLIFNCSARVLKRMRETNGCNKSNSKTHFCALGCRRKHWRKIDVGISQLSLRLLLHRNTKRNLPLRELCFRGAPPSARLTKVTLFGDHAEHTPCKRGAASSMPDIEVRECESDVLPNKPRHPKVPQLVVNNNKPGPQLKTWNCREPTNVALWPICQSKADADGRSADLGPISGLSRAHLKTPDSPVPTDARLNSSQKSRPNSRPK